MNSEQLNAIKERTEKADRGEWYRGVNNSVNARRGDYNWGITDVISKENAEFIAHAREDIPQLIAEVERLKAELHRIAYEKTMSHYLSEGAMASDLKRIAREALGE